MDDAKGVAVGDTLTGEQRDTVGNILGAALGDAVGDTLTGEQ